MLQLSGHLGRCETSRDVATRFRNSFTEKWVNCTTFLSVYNYAIFLLSCEGGLDLEFSRLSDPLMSSLSLSDVVCSV